MAKANKKAIDIENTSNNFDTVITQLSKIAIQVEPIMPLVTKSLNLTMDLLRLYQAAFERGAKVGRYTKR